MKTNHRQFIAESINKNNEMIFSDQTKHHIINVLKYTEQDTIIALLEKDKYLIEIAKNNDNYIFTIIEKLTSQNILYPKIHLFNSLIKTQNLELVIEKVTEIGVDEIHLFTSNNTYTLNELQFANKVSRWNKIIQNSIEQSRSNTITKIANHLYSFNALIKKLKDFSIVLIANENEQNFSLKNIENDILNYENIALLIGPEKGWTEKEITTFIANGFKSISLGTNTLKTETASIQFVSLINYFIKKDNLQN